MTPEQHNKYLGLAHLGYASLFFLFTLAMMAFFVVMAMAAPQSPDEPPPWIFLVFAGFIAISYLPMLLPSLIAGYALLRRRKWAKVASIVAAVMAGMTFPFGTAVCVYTLWFVFSEPGSSLYDNRTLPPPPPRWTFDGQPEPQKVLAPKPLDWR